VTTLAEKKKTKLARRKPTKTNRTGPKPERELRTKRDTAAVLAHEAEVSTPRARATLAKDQARRVRASK
jgi:hypothetical protein